MEFDNGEIYIQSLSSMLPVFILDPKPGEKILDMCASPGSKTTQINEITLKKAEITANEKQRSRFFKMKDTLKRYSGDNIKTILCDAKVLPFKYPEFKNYFDKILLDAPCSNEANLKFFSMIDLKNWNPKLSKELSVLQKGLVNSACKMLKPGGTLVYSTCTYSVLENENVVDYALEKNPDLQILDFKINLPNIKRGFKSFRDKDFDDRVEKTVRILPDGYFSGFFIAKFSK